MSRDEALRLARGILETSAYAENSMVQLAKAMLEEAAEIQMEWFSHA